MALAAGRLIVTLEYAQHLKKRKRYTRVGPYAVITCGNQRLRSQTSHGASDPTWAEMFEFHIVDEICLDVELWDQAYFGRDHALGCASVSLTQARMMADIKHMTVPVMSRSRRRQQHQLGVVVLSLAFVPSGQPYSAPAAVHASSAHSAGTSAAMPLVAAEGCHLLTTNGMGMVAQGWPVSNTQQPQAGWPPQHEGNVNKATTWLQSV